MLALDPRPAELHDVGANGRLRRSRSAANHDPDDVVFVPEGDLVGGALLRPSLGVLHRVAGSAVRKDQEDLVYKTKREKYKSVIDEIENLRNAGRPVLVGTTSVEVSELLAKMLQGKKIPHNVLNAKQHAREAQVVAEAGLAGAVTIATNMAGRGTDIKLGPGVKEAGGLAIIGTERHESRRVDRQLRGRAGRQGDPGTTQFYVSLEDDLMRL